MPAQCVFYSFSFFFILFLASIPAKTLEVLELNSVVGLGLADTVIVLKMSQSKVVAYIHVRKRST